MSNQQQARSVSGSIPVSALALAVGAWLEEAQQGTLYKPNQMRGPRMGGWIRRGWISHFGPRISVHRSQNVYFKGFGDPCTENWYAKEAHPKKPPPPKNPTKNSVCTNSLPKLFLRARASCSIERKVSEGGLVAGMC